ncbi:MAG: tetratricopeptide repeat protein [Bradyrhizobiaceae bacterium]|nr:tetratricopeptide repeat protein [Bradyrhizobiaceae bacterium]
MSDIIREVDEELRHERYKKLWDRYGLYVIGAALLLVLAVAGWRGWEWYAAREAAKSGAQFEAAMQLAAEGKRDEAEAAFNALAKEGTAGYRVLARFSAAAELARKDVNAGVAAFDAIAADASIDAVLRDVARLRAGYLLVDTASVKEIADRMQPLFGPSAPFRHSANELIALSHFRAGESTAAAKIVSELLTDPEIPPSMRPRLQVLNALVAGAAAGPAAAPATQ